MDDPARPDPDDIERIYRRLRRGMGRECVTEDNVQPLIRRAQQDGHAVLAEELREWAAGCGAPARPAGSG